MSPTIIGRPISWPDLNTVENIPHTDTVPDFGGPTQYACIRLGYRRGHTGVFRTKYLATLPGKINELKPLILSTQEALPPSSQGFHSET